MTGGLARWRALSAWGWDFLRESIGDVEINALVSRSKSFVIDPDEQRPVWSLRRMKLRECLEVPSDGAEPREYYYLAFLSIPFKFPRLMDDIEPPPFLDPRRLLKRSPQLWISPQEVSGPLHFDLYESFLAVVRGRRRVTLAAPGRFSRFYPYPLRADGPAGCSRVDAERPDFDRFPRFRGVETRPCVVEAGEMLYIPPRWWHQVHSLEAGVSVTWWYSAPLSQWLNRYGFELMRESLLAKTRSLAGRLSFKPRALRPTA